MAWETVSTIRIGVRWVTSEGHRTNLTGSLKKQTNKQYWKWIKCNLIVLYSCDPSEPKRNDVKKCATRSVYWVNLNFKDHDLIDLSLYAYLCIAICIAICVLMEGCTLWQAYVMFYSSPRLPDWPKQRYRYCKKSSHSYSFATNFKFLANKFGFKNERALPHVVISPTRI